MVGLGKTIDFWQLMGQLVRVAVCLSLATLAEPTASRAWGQSPGSQDSWEQIAADAIAAADVPVDQKSALILRAIRMAQKGTAPVSPQDLGKTNSQMLHANSDLAQPVADLGSPSRTIRKGPDRQLNTDPNSTGLNSATQRHVRLTPAILPRFQFSDDLWLQSTSPQEIHPSAASNQPLVPNLATQWSNVLEPKLNDKMLQPKVFEFSVPTINRERAARTGPMDLRR